MGTGSLGMVIIFSFQCLAHTTPEFTLFHPLYIPNKCAKSIVPISLPIPLRP